MANTSIPHKELDLLLNTKELLNYFTDKPGLFQKLVDYISNSKNGFPAQHVTILQHAMIEHSLETLTFETQADCERFPIKISAFTQNWILQYGDDGFKAGDWTIYLWAENENGFPCAKIDVDAKKIFLRILPSIQIDTTYGDSIYYIYPILCNKEFILPWEANLTDHWLDIWKAVKKAKEDRYSNCN